MYNIIFRAGMDCSRCGMQLWNIYFFPIVWGYQPDVKLSLHVVVSAGCLV